jgi:hypothetical protein
VLVLLRFKSNGEAKISQNNWEVLVWLLLVVAAIW